LSLLWIRYRLLQMACQPCLHFYLVDLYVFFFMTFFRLLIFHHIQHIYYSHLTYNTLYLTVNRVHLQGNLRSTPCVEGEQKLNKGETVEPTTDAAPPRFSEPKAEESIIGADEGLRAVMQRVNQVAPSEATVLILGETGSGKEVIARAIHARSKRQKNAFVRVNCGALPPELIDSELFGHQKGSFTGAVAQRRGWFERADRGTLLLDEVGELPMAAQVRLLRVLQDGIIQRVGSEEDIAVDVRVIAATHRDLPHMVQEGKFREDLWYRLAVFPIILPALHERSADIKPLALHFIHRAAQRLGLPTPLLKATDLQLLLSYRWPGNVRELGSVLERAVILGQQKELDLKTALGAEGLRKFSSSPSKALSSEAGEVLIQPLETIIKEHIELALAKTGGRVDGPRGAANLLGLNTSTLRGKLRKHGIDPSNFKD
jgi:transcriptional regulator with GAF, ATPase, and Fis domain